MVGHGRSNKSDLQRLVFETRLDKTWEIESHMSHNNLTEELWLPTILLIPVQYPVWVKHRNPLTQILVLTPTIRDFPAVLSPNVQWLPPSNWELHTPQARLDAKACKVGYEKKDTNYSFYWWSISVYSNPTKVRILETMEETLQYISST
jgi:hypothetical protein